MRLEVGTNSNLYKRWAAPSYEFEDGIESNYEDYKHYLKIKSRNTRLESQILQTMNYF